MQKIMIYLKKGIVPIIILVCILFIYLILRGCGSKGKKTYEFAKATKGQVKKTINVSGKLEVLNSYTILSKINGLVNKVYVDFNQKVKRGQLLAKLDSLSIDQEILKIAAKLETARMELKATKKELDAKRNMYNDKLISKTGLHQAELKNKTAYSKYKQVQIDYNLSLKQRNYTRISSPISGIVMSREVDDNSPVAQNKVLFIIAQNLKKMRLIISIDESDIGNIKKNQKVYFNVSAFPEKQFNGKISQVRMTPVQKGSLVTYQSVVVCDNDELLLKPGMTANATVVVNRKENVIRVLNNAFVVSLEDDEFNPNKKYIWRKKGDLLQNNVEKVEVGIGLKGDLYTEITKNIKIGEKILIKVTDSQ